MSPRGVYNRGTVRVATSNDRETRRAAAVATVGGDQSPEAEVSAKVRKAIDAIRRPFTSFVADFASLSVSREELAPKFMKTFGLWQSEAGGTFVDFIRVLVPEVGATRQEYRAHRAYQAADYLRRLAQQANRQGTSAEERAEAIANRPVSHVTAMARLLRTLIPAISQDAQATLWQALSDQLHWSERMVTRVQEMAKTEQPLVVIREKRGLHALGTLTLAIPAPPQGTSATGESDEAEAPRTGTHG